VVPLSILRRTTAPERRFRVKDESGAYGTLVMITTDGMGQAETPLKHRLVRTYLQLLLEGGPLPGAVCFYADGVKLAAEGSHVLDLLASLESRGVHLILCQTCLNYHGLAERVRVGVVGGMTDILGAQTKADKVITL
jgi:hypothetical protein